MPVSYKIYGKSLPETIDPEIRVCFSIEIPDTPQYRAALLGQLEWLGDWRCWEHIEEDYPIPPTRNVDAAQLFVSAVVDGRFGECGEMSCEDIADCIESDAGTQAAIADAMENFGAPVPGRPMTAARSAADVLPDNVRDEFGECIDDALWGAVLFLVQSGNRAVTDFFEQIEAASNTLETSAIVSGAIPAAGQYASAALEFADQLQENLAEGYAAGYTEAYENELACNIFCAAKENCELTPDMLVDIVNLMLPDPDDMLDFGMVMARIGSGVFTGPEIPSAAFLIYFTALKFGQQFGATIGVRPLTDLMGLGADQLASDNWMTLCECVEGPQLQIYNQAPNFGGTLRDTIEFENGVPFIVDSINFDTVRHGVFIEAPDGNWTMAYTIAPDPVSPTNPGEITWVYVNTSGSAVAAVGPVPASDFPTPVDTMHIQNSNIYGCGWESFEGFTLMITLTAI